MFAIPSFHEGTPFALLEAMAMGLPIIASQVGSIPEIIDGNGYLVCVLEPEETFVRTARPDRQSESARTDG